MVDHFVEKYLWRFGILPMAFSQVRLHEVRLHEVRFHEVRLG